MKRSYWIAAGVTLAVTAWVASGLLDRTPPAAPPAASATPAAPSVAVRVRTVEAEPHGRVLLQFGRTEAGRAVEVRAETKGRVVQQVATKGARVAAGDVLIRLSMDDREARLREAQSLVQQWERKFEATQQLSRSGFQSEVRKAEDWAALEGARARLTAASLDIERTEIRAPFAGVVEALPAEVGYLADVQDPVATVVELDPLKVVVEVPEREVDGLAVGGEAEVRLITGQVLPGRLRYIARTATAATRTFRVELEIANPENAVGEGITAEVSLSRGQLLAHRVSPAILTLDDDGAVGVKTVDDQQRVVFHPVAIVDQTTEGIWLAGLPPRVTLIVVGQEFVRPGQRVTPVEAEPAPAGSAS
jgi:multidrug efflux system membrane fusion protein